ncbi:MAG: hypothetical protein ACLRZH_19100 [Ruthenibacterium lactatiformans]
MRTATGTRSSTWARCSACEDEGPEWLAESCHSAAGLNCPCSLMTPTNARCILNGAHTGFVLGRIWPGTTLYATARRTM